MKGVLSVLVLGALRAAAPAARGNGPGNGWADATRLRCESNDGRYRLCEPGRDIRDARLVRQLSNADCRQGRSWGVRDGGLWVDRGCRGEFDVRHGWRPGPGPGGGYTVTCTSRDGHYTTCGWDAR